MASLKDLLSASEKDSLQKIRKTSEVKQTVHKNKQKFKQLDKDIVFVDQTPNETPHIEKVKPALITGGDVYYDYLKGCVTGGKKPKNISVILENIDGIIRRACYDTNKKHATDVFLYLIENDFISDTKYKSNELIERLYELQNPEIMEIIIEKNPGWVYWKCSNIGAVQNAEQIKEKHFYDIYKWASQNGKKDICSDMIDSYVYDIYINAKNGKDTEKYILNQLEKDYSYQLFKQCLIHKDNNLKDYLLKQINVLDLYIKSKQKDKNVTNYLLLNYISEIYKQANLSSNHVIIKDIMNNIYNTCREIQNQTDIIAFMYDIMESVEKKKINLFYYLQDEIKKHDFDTYTECFFQVYTKQILDFKLLQKEVKIIEKHVEKTPAIAKSNIVRERSVGDTHIKLDTTNTHTVSDTSHESKPYDSVPWFNPHDTGRATLSHIAQDCIAGGGSALGSDKG